jgi:hypothetical protein
MMMFNRKVFFLFLVVLCCADEMMASPIDLASSDVTVPSLVFQDPSSSNLVDDVEDEMRIDEEQESSVAPLGLDVQTTSGWIRGKIDGKFWYRVRQFLG